MRPRNGIAFLLQRSLALLSILFIAASVSAADAMHPIERQVRDLFPSIALDSRVTLEELQELVAQRVVTGMRAASESSALRVFYPGSCDGRVFVKGVARRLRVAHLL